MAESAQGLATARRIVSARFTALLSALLIAGAGSAFGDVVTIDIPDASLTAAEAINGSGLIGGFFDDQSGTTHGFVLVRGIPTPIDVPGATATLVKGVNDSGTVVGDYVQNSTDHGFSLSNGSF